MKLHVSTPWGHLQAYKIWIIQGTSEVVTYILNIHPRPTHGQSDNRSQDKHATWQRTWLVHRQSITTTASHSLTSRKFHTSTPKKTSHQHRDLHSTTQEADSYHIQLKIWDRAPTPLSRYSKRCRAPRSIHGHLDDIELLPYKDATSTNSEFELSTNRGHTPTTYGIRPPIHREVPIPRP